MVYNVNDQTTLKRSAFKNKITQILLFDDIQNEIFGDLECFQNILDNLFDEKLVEKLKLTRG